MGQPKYRADTKGTLVALKDDCAFSFRGEMSSIDAFCTDWDACVNTVREYGDYLTVAEMKACFKKAQQSE